MQNVHSLPILYSFRRCPYAMRARLAIAVSGQQTELREVILRNKPLALLNASPKATVPVLVDDGVVIDQSLDIMLWALQRHDPQAWLSACGAATNGGEALNQMLALINHCDHVFKHHLDRYKYPNRYDLPDGVADRDAAAAWLVENLSHRLQEGGQLFGAQSSLADMAILPFVRQYANTDKTWFYAQPWPELVRWLDQFLNSTLFASVMEKHTPWQEHEQGVLFP